MTPAISLVDADVHPMTRDGWRDLRAYVDAGWARRLERYEALLSRGAHFNLSAFTRDGGRPGSDPEYMREELLERNGVDRAILVPLEAIYAAGVGAADETVELVRAVNDYFVDRWLSADSRYRLAAGVSPHDPARAVAEIERVARTPEVVAIVLPPLNLPLGHRWYHPIYDAAAAHGLPVFVHVGNQGGPEGMPAFAGGRPANYIQRHCLFGQFAMANVVSLAVEGTFVRFSTLKVVLSEYGFSWLPHVLWRLDHVWRERPDELPGLAEAPSAYIRRNVRFTSQPVDEPERPEDIVEMLEMAHADEVLMFSTDYPHWDNEFPDSVFRGLPDALRARILAGCALETFPRIT